MTCNQTRVRALARHRELHVAPARGIRLIHAVILRTVPRDQAALVIVLQLRQGSRCFGPEHSEPDDLTLAVEIRAERA
eukprot:scaffold4340_cov89-Phaeocystis_antarctica.AAC.1